LGLCPSIVPACMFAPDRGCAEDPMGAEGFADGEGTNGESVDHLDLSYKLVLVSPTGEQYDSLLRQLRERIEEGCGETIYVVGMGSGSMDEFKVSYGVLAHGSLIFIPKKGQPKYILFVESFMVVNKPDSHGGGLDWTKICEKSSKVITFIDLAGHEKYLKTTVFGMTGHMPDFCMLMVGSNAGIVGMTKEHLGLALALNVPVFVVVTKIDMCPANILQGKETFFSMNGVGTVVSGTTLRGLIRLNDTLLLGPDPLGIFIPIAVKSIHRKRMPVKEVHGGQTASFALKKIKRSSIRKGMVMVSPKLMPQATWEFEAEILVLHHPTTISPRYQAMVHCGSIRQTATILTMNKDCLRTGDKASVHFRFIKTPEYLHCDQKLVFREGRTKAVGTITKMFLNLLSPRTTFSNDEPAEFQIDDTYSVPVSNSMHTRLLTLRLFSPPPVSILKLGDDFQKSQRGQKRFQTINLNQFKNRSESKFDTVVTGDC
uniref:GTP-binding protein 1 n=1 Tax=Fundulus heteroclitus TaxID=8078 RepID=A0A3Q2PG08_FUNHE